MYYFKLTIFTTILLISLDFSKGFKLQDYKARNLVFKNEKLDRFRREDATTKATPTEDATMSDEEFLKFAFQSTADPVYYLNITAYYELLNLLTTTPAPTFGEKVKNFFSFVFG
ncbi:Hypothetical protein SRAE_2000465200 [Strongyloides ratti]|uniref:Uncharacterized protein n=1 Tax=Strongyloides ratti TaxID=34506 RepID=A0A090LQX6_STRRB|nr:Hypothetical protein SRAE_2000465000 [Strongyloides ratti]XP_024509208.1 Hypothetical protein SRAE_2000465200 [Strongyloides ratti]CEF70006.1 Hypothetical protein SRAE_2000465000 [Strongyloides ratti]CEF70009.1 Hypothetical protein SRAE_2000465200 [Strongyloides ratti]